MRIAIQIFAADIPIAEKQSNLSWPHTQMFVILIARWSTNISLLETDRNPIVAYSPNPQILIKRFSSKLQDLRYRYILWGSSSMFPWTCVAKQYSMMKPMSDINKTFLAWPRLELIGGCTTCQTGKKFENSSEKNGPGCIDTSPLQWFRNSFR